MQPIDRWEDHRLHELPADDLVGHEMVVQRDVDALTFRHVVDIPDDLGDLARVGVAFEVPARFGTVRWFGLGPHENYPDRASSAPLGVWEGAPDELPYLVPQEFGLRTECRWIELIAGPERLVIDVVEPMALHFSAIHHTADDLYRAPTALDLVRRPGVVVGLDVAHRGVGTASCGPDTRLEYRISPGRFEFAYRVTVTKQARLASSR